MYSIVETIWQKCRLVKMSSAPFSLPNNRLLSEVTDRRPLSLSYKRWKIGRWNYEIRNPLTCFCFVPARWLSHSCSLKWNAQWKNSHASSYVTFLPLHRKKKILFLARLSESNCFQHQVVHQEQQAVVYSLLCFPHINKDEKVSLSYKKKTIVWKKTKKHGE